MNCRFNELFQTLPEKTVLMREVNSKPYRFYNPRDMKREWVASLLQKYQQNTFNKTIYIEDVKKMVRDGYDFSKLGEYSSLLIESSSRFFYPPNGTLYQHFKPLPEIMSRIDKISCSFSNDTVGVHIRRADHLKAIENSPLELFIHMMKKEIEINTNTNFFVASDDLTVKTELSSLFGDKIILSSSKDGERSTKEGVKGAVVDLYSLSRTKKVLASYGSSFSHTACHLSSIEEVVVKRSHTVR